VHPDNRRRPTRALPIAGTRELSALTTRLLVHSGFAESAGKAVEDRLHHVLEKRTLSGLDVNVGRHPGRRDEFRHAPENVILVQTHPNDIEFPTRVTVGLCFGLHLHLARQGVRGHVDDARLDQGTSLSRDAVEHRLAKYVQIATGACPSLGQKTISMHVLRHSAAMRLLRAGVETSVIALWLGHEQVETTHIYLHADMGIKERALAATAPAEATAGRFRPNDKLLAFLEAL